MGKKIHIIPHSHWDREWYFTTSRSKVYLLKDLGDVLTKLETDPRFTSYLLDGQSCLLDDYLAFRPEDEDRIRKLVQAGRLIVGPWYTQTDQMLASGESIVRNLYYGMQRADEMGATMHIGYVPDSFGQAGNMPQIYRQAGIEDTLFWRGVSDDMVEHTDFMWKGDDGSRVFAKQIPHGYYIGGNIPEGPADAAAFWDKQCLDVAGGPAATDNIYFPVGFDQAPIRTNLPELIAARNAQDPHNIYEISTIERYINETKAAAKDLEEVQGELLVGKQMRIHRSIWSSRSDLKALNTKAQFFLTNIMEPLLLLSQSLGNDYPHGVVDTIWKLMFENAAHDSIGASVSDEVNKDIYLRYKQVHDLATSLVELHSRLIATSIRNAESSHTVTIFNTLPQLRSAVAVEKLYVPGEPFELLDPDGHSIPYTIIKKHDLTKYVLSQTIRLNPSRPIDIPERIFEATVAIAAEQVPSMGYVSYTFSEGISGEDPMQTLDHLENNRYRIDINTDGSLCVQDKASGHIYDHEAIIAENGDDGDSFNSSPAHNDLRILSSEYTPEIKIEGSSIWQHALISFKMLVPRDLDERSRHDRTAVLPVTLEVILTQGADVIDLTVTIDNRTVDSHRVCLLLDPEIATSYNYADEQFGTIKRDNVHAEQLNAYLKSLLNAQDIPEGTTTSSLPTNWVQNPGSWQEPPVSIEPTQSFVAMTDGKKGIAALPLGVREYEIVDEFGHDATGIDLLDQGSVPKVSKGPEHPKLQLTLFRTYGQMGKENLLYRPGRASGETAMLTPDAQLHKKMTYRVGLTLFASAINASGVEHIARAYDTPLTAYEYAPFLNGRLIFSEEERVGTREGIYSLLSYDGDFEISAIKPAEQRSGIIVRLYNGKVGCEETDKTTGVMAGRLMFKRSVQYASIVNLREQNIRTADFDVRYVTVPELSPCEFVTLYIELGEA